ncbi:hypothetical protein ES707_13161 [subsurface metagenome]
MIIECPECGTKNTTDKPTQPGKRYHCGKCGAEITFLQASDSSSEVASSTITGLASNTSRVRTVSNEGSPVLPKVAVVPFESGHYRTQWVTFFLASLVLIGIIAVSFDYLEIQLINKIISGDFFTIEEVYASDNRQATIGFFYLALFVITGILFLMWIHRAHRNLPSLGNTNLKYSPGWAVGWFFVPILSWWKPYQVTTEIWKASDPTTDIKDSTAWQKSPASSLVSSWWFLFLVSIFIGNIAIRYFLRAETLNEILTASWWGLVIDVIDISTVILTMLLVRNIDQRQETKNQLLKTPLYH